MLSHFIFYQIDFLGQLSFMIWFGNSVNLTVSFESYNFRRAFGHSVYMVIQLYTLVDTSLGDDTTQEIY